ETPLKIGLLLNFTGSPEASADRQRAFELAILHVNEAGGVLGMPVVGVVADATGDPDRAVEEATRLVDEEGVHAIVGPNASSASLPVAEKVSASHRIPTISPSATSPLLTDVHDDGYFFRTAISDVAQGPILADVTRRQGFTNIALIYQDDAYGAGLADAFTASWDGPLESVSVDPNWTDFTAPLLESVRSGSQALVVIGFEGLAIELVMQAIDIGYYSEFVFADSAKRLSLIQEVGVDRLAGMYGTGSAPPPQSNDAQAWDAAYIATYGELPVLAYVKETYDATVAIALAAEAAGSVDGEAIRDQLRDIARPPGETIPGTAKGVADGLATLADGRDIDYDGTSGVLEWDEHGDVRRGYIGVWRFTPDGGIEDLESIPYE
ncbi:MAG: ABC transporter substrate-binding protein, partial [Dehalococcoidia bacterium]|nr:ABC transporter substrate-binding protein [Dehalococcoidia bacterium]